MELDVEKVKETLENEGISYTDFAKKFGIHRSYVYNAISGAAVPGRKFFAAWASFCRLYGLDFLDYVIFYDVK